MIDSIAQWFLFLLWNLPLSSVFIFTFLTLFAWSCSIIYSAGCIIFEYIPQRKALKKLRVERKLQMLYFRTHPFDIDPWNWKNEMFSNEDDPNIVWKLIGVHIAWWFIMLFVVHFLMAHVFGYDAAKQAVTMTEDMLSFFLPPYQEYKVWLFHFWFWGGIPVFIYIIVAQAFNDKAHSFVYQELRYDWFKEFVSQMSGKNWKYFGEEYLNINFYWTSVGMGSESRLKEGIAFRGHKDDFKEDSDEVKESWMRDFFWRKMKGENSYEVYYPLEHDVYPTRRKSKYRESSFWQECNRLIRAFPLSTLFDIYLQVGFEKGYIEELSIEKIGKKLRLTTPVENKTDTSQ